MEHADGDAPIDGARQPDLDEGEEVKYIKHNVSVFLDDRCLVPPLFLLSAGCSLVRARCALAWCLLILSPFWQGPVWEWDAVFNDGEHHLAWHGGCGEDAVLPLAVDANACNLPRYFVLSAPLRVLSGLPRAHGHHGPPVLDHAYLATRALLELPPDNLPGSLQVRKSDTQTIPEAADTGTAPEQDEDDDEEDGMMPDEEVSASTCFLPRHAESIALSCNRECYSRSHRAEHMLCVWWLS